MSKLLELSVMSMIFVKDFYPGGIDNNCTMEKNGV